MVNVSMGVEYAAMSSGLEDRFQNLHEIVKAAKGCLPQGPWDYLIGGTETETTVRRNRHAIDAIALRPRVLRDVANVDVSTTFLGKRLRLPVLTAPIGGLESFEPGGGATVARATGEFGVIQMLSSVCMPGLEETAKAADNVRIFQLYVRGDYAWVDDHVKRAIDHGYAAFTITVDTAHYSRRERDIATRFVKPWRQRATGFNYQSGMTWDLIKHFKDHHQIPLGLKGIATAEDAELCVQHGVDMVYVSNHGGRQLDQGRGSIDVLPEVLQAVNGRAKVIVDGGFTRGTDIVKAIALGADLVGLGRLPCYGLAAAGAPGVVRVLELLEDEVRIALGLLGVSSLSKLDRSYLHMNAPVVTAPHVHSALPLIGEGY
ncbi:MAG: alpha-hydroxy-acid oxidizing protein [Candidatus Rokubacteria bacterium]|nr:alpha-hydroxy-acid oxidizing protein [Candidatus Rokubacteria bacterium]